MSKSSNERQFGSDSFFPVSVNNQLNQSKSLHSGIWIVGIGHCHIFLSVCSGQNEPQGLIFNFFHFFSFLVLLFPSSLGIWDYRLTFLAWPNQVCPWSLGPQIYPKEDSKNLFYIQPAEAKSSHDLSASLECPEKFSLFACRSRKK